MKRIIILLGAVLALSTAAAFAADEAVPVKLSLLPGIAVPSSQTVHGLDLALLATKVDEMHGYQWSFFYSGARNNVIGIQHSLVCTSPNVEGLQSGLVNVAGDVQGFQIGLVNVTDTMKGIQIGLVNVIKKSSLPVMVIVNASF